MMTTSLGIVLFLGVEELDFVGPWEVLRSAQINTDADLSVCTVAQRRQPIECNKGLTIVPQHDFASCPTLDAVLVPGGRGTRRERGSPAILGFLRQRCADADWMISVCTGVMLLSAAGLISGRRVTTHWAAIAELRGFDPSLEVCEGERYVRDGNLLTSAGVSAGIDMSLWLLGELYGPDLARRVQKGIEYFPVPPYGSA
ncbi:MAG: DJ-1/PfpI family protein [Pseudomonadota bacterium]